MTGHRSMPLSRSHSSCPGIVTIGSPQYTYSLSDIATLRQCDIATLRQCDNVISSDIRFEKYICTPNEVIYEHVFEDTNSQHLPSSSAVDTLPGDTRQDAGRTVQDP